MLYHLGSRGIEWDLLGDCAKRKVAVMAYSPLGQGGILRDKALAKVAERHGVSVAAIALAWTMRHPHVIAIPKASRPEHVRENLVAADLTLTAADLADLDAAFAPPKRATPLGCFRQPTPTAGRSATLRDTSLRTAATHSAHLH